MNPPHCPIAPTEQHPAGIGNDIQAIAAEVLRLDQAWIDAPEDETCACLDAFSAASEYAQEHAPALARAVLAQQQLQHVENCRDAFQMSERNKVEAFEKQLAAKDAEIAGLRNQVVELRSDCGMPTCGPGLRETIEEWKVELATAADNLKLAEDALAKYADPDYQPIGDEAKAALAAIHGSANGTPA